MLEQEDAARAVCAQCRPARAVQRDSGLLLARVLPAWALREADSDADQGNVLPTATAAELRSSGLLSLPIAESYGGPEASLFECARLVRQVAREAPATALCLVMPLGNAANTRVPDAAVPADARDQLARGRAFIASNTLLGRVLAVANSEPGAGGSLENTRTSAVRDAAGVYRLTGTKSFATWGAAADFFLCSARTEKGELDAFFVARDAPGVRVHDDWDALGMRASASVGITLEGAPASARFLHAGAIAGASARHWSTILLSAVFLGVGEGALEIARTALGGGTSYAHCTLAESVLALEAAWGLIEALCYTDRVPADAAHRDRCQRAKTFTARVAVESTTRALMVSGGRAYRPRHVLARFLHAALAGPLVRPPLAGAMDNIALNQLTLRG